MNQSPQPDPIVQRIVRLVPLLVELGRTDGAIVIPDALVVKGWDFAVLWKRWDQIVNGWSATQIAYLIKGLTYFEKTYPHGFGSAPPVANLYRIYVALVDEEDRNELADWVLANTVNDYCPFGTHNHGAKSLPELAEKYVEIAARKRTRALQEREKTLSARSRQTQQATERLPNALRRKDAKAVAALIAKGADADAIGISGLTARRIAKDLGIEGWLSRHLSDIE